MPGSSAQACSEAFMIHLLPFHCFLSLVPRELCSGMDRVFLLILKYRYVSAGRLHLQWAGLTWCGLGEKKWKCAPCIWFFSSWESSDIQECFLHWKWFPNEWFHFSLCREKLARPRDYTTETIQPLWDSPLFGSCVLAELQTHRFSTCKPETTTLTARGS